MKEMSFLIEAARYGNLYKKGRSKSSQVRKTLNNNFYGGDERNPYNYIIEKLSQRSSTKIEHKDIAYLKDLGVYPPNKMFILRRFDQTDVKGPEADLNSDEEYKNKKPISKIIGWIEEDSDLFNLTVNEGWTRDSSFIHDLIGEIFKDAGISLSNIQSVPSWSQGLLFDFLQSSGIIDKDTKILNLLGNPNVLDQGATREGGGENSSYSLKSNWKFTLKTRYEAKYIYDIDPVDAMKSIIDNALSMGSSPEVNFALSSEMFKGMSKFGNPEVKKGYDDMKKLIKDLTTKIKNNITSSEDENTTDDPDDPNEEKNTNPFSDLTNSLDDIGGDLFSSTIGKFRWNVRGTYGVHSGNNTTPWHLTIGNPLSPVLSLNNIVVDNVKISSPNEFTFNDVPKYVDVEIEVSNSRDLGTNKLASMFFRRHNRTYDSPEIIEGTLQTLKPYNINNNKSNNIPTKLDRSLNIERMSHNYPYKRNYNNDNDDNESFEKPGSNLGFLND